jgi:Asp-tRNA(Asn)/Glu-tRNA(Gln) amidotransferase A subunit family amidase
LVRVSAIGIGSVTFQRALAHKAVTTGEITEAMIREAQWIADLELTEDEIKALLKELKAQQENERKLRECALDADVGPASVFTPYFFAENIPASEEPGNSSSAVAPNRSVPLWNRAAIGTMESHVSNRVDWNDESSIAAAGVLEQAEGIRSGKITSKRLTELYLARLKKHDPVLRCVVNLTEERALQQAAKADTELGQGLDRGLLHGIPWGAKDIIAIPPFKTTWGGKPYRDQVRPNMATVVDRLDQAGAVLLGKLSVGTYAWGDVWYDGTTKNPWNVEQGSSGSSAGSSSAVGAGLCTFALGSETLGSIVSPTRRCRVMGLRPSFGRVSRYGCMPLAWSMDKIGPIARHAIDCGIVLSAIHGFDGKDPTAVDRPFAPLKDFSVQGLKIGIVEGQLSESEKIVLEQLKADGAKLVTLAYPTTIPQEALMVGLDVESASMFDSLFRTSQSEEDFGLWGPSFRKSQFVRGIHYVQSMRARTLLIQETEKVLREVDVVLGSDDLLRTNLTGHPSMVVRCGTQELRREKKEGEEDTAIPMAPRTIKLTAKYFSESILVSLGHHLQMALPPEPVLPAMFR